MAEDIIFKVGVDSDGSGAKSLKQLKQEFIQLQEELSKTVKGTKEYNQTLTQLADVKDEMKDLNTAINTLNPEGKIQAFTGVAGSLASGFQAATGAAALFGAESEELEKTLLRVQAASALAQGINGIIGITDAFKVLGVVLAANPIMAIGAIILAVVAGTKLLIDATDEYAETQKRLNEQLSIYEENLKITQQNEEIRIRQLKANGATEKEILEERIRLIEEQTVLAQDAAVKQLEILKNSNEEERKANYDKYIQLFTQLGDYELQVKEARFALTEFLVNADKEEAKKRAEAAKKANEERIKDLKERINGNIDLKTGIISVSVKTPDPIVSAQLAKYSIEKDK